MASSSTMANPVRGLVVRTYICHGHWYALVQGFHSSADVSVTVQTPSPVYLCCVCALLCPLQKAKATTKDILAEAGKHSFAEQAMFDKVPATEPHTTPVFSLGCFWGVLHLPHTTPVFSLSCFGGGGGSHTDCVSARTCICMCILTYGHMYGCMYVCMRMSLLCCGAADKEDSERT